jgi:DNA mismatch repair protein MutS
LEDPKKTKFLVKRGVIELVTPGVSYCEYSTDSKSNTFLASVFFQKSETGLALLDLSTGEFLITEGPHSTIDKLLNNFQPKEIIYPKGQEARFQELFGQKFYIYPIEEWFFEKESSEERLIKHFDVISLKGFGIELMNHGISAAGAILSYLEMTKHDMISHITSIAKIDESHCVLLDKFTLRNLELLHSSYEGGKSLIDIIDKTITPMGGRTLRRWICMPLKSPQEINQRLDIVEHFIQQEEARIAVEELLKNIGDLERLTSRIGVGRITPREMNQLRIALSCIAPLKQLCTTFPCQALQAMSNNLETCTPLYEKICQQIQENARHKIWCGEIK